MKKLRVLDLFSGIGGFSLGLERTGGFETVAFCEIDPFCRRVLAKHWTGVPIYDDVATLEPVGPVDLVTAGFPCQDVSFAGKGAGLAGERSGLFWHVIRTAGMVGFPKLLLENVAALLDRGMGTVLGAMASVGYDAEWHCIPASAVGFAHERDRLWIVADPHKDRLRASWQDKEEAAPAELLNGSVIEAARVGEGRSIVSDVGSAVYGFPGVVDALRPLGNAVVPKIPELIGRAILESRAAA